jgi:hypothetical protein
MRRSSSLDRVKVLTIALVVSTLAPELGSAQESVGRARQGLRYAEDDVDTPAANAVVWANGCTATLLTPTMVVSAGHCFTHGTRLREDAGLVCSDKEVPGRWYPVEESIEIRVGNDRTTPDFTARGTEYSVPGCADIFMIRLDSPVPSSVAEPAKVLISAGGRDGAGDAPFLEGAELTMVGWGLTESSTAPRLRQIGSGSFLRNDGEKIYVRGSGSTITGSGDSGGPLFWEPSPGRRFVVGILQGFTVSPNENRYTPTFRNRVAGKPSVGDWFRDLVPSAVYCDAAGSSPSGTVPLISMWSPSREDNFTTTAPAWMGCEGTVRSPDYRYVRLEGHIFDPARPQPQGTVKLYSWYSRTRGDNFATSHPRWIHWSGDGRRRDPDYGLVRLEGYVFSPDRPQPRGTVPLYRWWSSARGDNWTSAAFERQGRRGEGLTPNYGPPRLMGYIFPPGR